MPSSFAQIFSIEATRPRPAEIEQIAAILPRGTPVYVTAVPTATPGETVAAATALRKAGLEPVVHVAARRLASAEMLQDMLKRLAGEAGARCLLVIGGDIDAVKNRDAADDVEDLFFQVHDVRFQVFQFAIRTLKSAIFY